MLPQDPVYDPLTIAHALHGGDVNILRYLSGGDFVVSNRVPHIFKNLTNGPKVLESTNEVEIPDVFGDLLLNLLSSVYDHMGDANYSIKNFHMNELIAHEMHMYDMYRRIAKEYESLSTLSPQTCTYIEDVLLPKVLDVQHELARRINYPERYYTKGPKGARSYNQYAQYVVTFNYRRQADFDDQKGFPALVDLESWSYWKVAMLRAPANVKDVAVFLKCMNA